MSNEKRIDLPSGAVAWITTRPTHEQVKVLRRHLLRAGRYLNEKRQPRPDLTSEEFDHYVELEVDIQSEQARTFALRSENLTDGQGEPINLPADADRMAERDFLALSDAITAVLLGREEAEGNAPSPSSSS